MNARQAVIRAGLTVGLSIIGGAALIATAIVLENEGRRDNEARIRALESDRPGYITRGRDVAHPPIPLRTPPVGGSGEARAIGTVRYAARGLGGAS